ncbi:hypothetical protein ABZ949_24125 [Micromonospora tulbaghiae]|uniref:hypothetical protein n=1 Tax=Micromonospora tulbaghiae TaxID=479978 RepID=UPI0033D9D9DB
MPRIGDGGADLLAAHDAGKAGATHQPLDRAPGRRMSLAVQLVPDLAGPVDAIVRHMDLPSYRVGFRRGDALLNVMGRFRMENYTDTLGAVAAHFDRHDRVLIVTDEQYNSGPYPLDRPDCAEGRSGLHLEHHRLQGRCERLGHGHQAHRWWPD